MYERNKKWKAMRMKKSIDERHKLEEEELKRCTFMPNAVQRIDKGKMRKKSIVVPKDNPVFREEFK